MTVGPSRLARLGGVPRHGVVVHLEGAPGIAREDVVVRVGRELDLEFFGLESSGRSVGNFST